MEITKDTQLSEILNNEEVEDIYSSFERDILSDCSKKSDALSTHMNNDGALSTEIVVSGQQKLNSMSKGTKQQYDYITNMLPGYFNKLQDQAIVTEAEELGTLRSRIMDYIDELEVSLTAKYKNWNEIKDDAGESMWNAFFGENGSVTCLNQDITNQYDRVKEINARITKIRPCLSNQSRKGDFANAVSIPSDSASRASYVKMSAMVYGNGDWKSVSPDGLPNTNSGKVKRYKCDVDPHEDITYIYEKVEVDGKVIYYHDTKTDTYYDSNGVPIMEEYVYGMVYDATQDRAPDPIPRKIVDHTSSGGSSSSGSSNSEDGDVVISYSPTSGSSYTVTPSSGGSDQDDNTSYSESSDDSGPFIPNDMDKYWLDE